MQKHSRLFTFCFLTTLTISPLVLHAANKSYCEDLARYSCAPGKFKDGTGEVKSNQEIEKQISDYSGKIRSRLDQQFRQALNDPKNQYFRDVSMSAYGLDVSPACNAQDAESKKECEDNLSEGLTNTAERFFFQTSSQTYDARQGNMRDLKFVMTNKAFTKVLETTGDEVEKDLSQPALAKKIEDKIFPGVKKAILDRIKKMDIPVEKKKLMIRKIQSISFEGTNCKELTNGTDKISPLLVPNAFYQPLQNTFKYCSGSLMRADSEFMIASIIAHELAHSIDPCSITTGPSQMATAYSDPNNFKKMEKEYPVSNVIRCLRGSDSIGARNLQEEQNRQLELQKKQMAQMNSNYAQGQQPGGMMPNPYSQPPNSMGYGYYNAQAPKEPNFCESDQIGEAFSDWLAAEVLPDYVDSNFKLTQDQYLNGYANVWRWNCSIGKKNESQPTMMFGQSSEPFRTHPETEGRVNKILLANPKVRKQLGCPEKAKNAVYCDSESHVSDEPVAEKIEETNLPYDTKGVE